VALKIAGHLFNGPHDIDTTVVRANHRPVVYAVISKEGAPWDPQFRLIDIDCSEAGGLVFSEHAKNQQWRRDCKGTLCLFLLPMDEGGGYKESDRSVIAERIRTLHRAPNDLITIVH
jgi:hypothetical protein